MSKISKFAGFPKSIEYEGIKFKIYPLKVRDLGLMSIDEKASNEEKINIAKKMIKKTVRIVEEMEGEEIDNEITNEEIDEMPMGLFTRIMNEINEINGFDSENGIREIKEKLTK